MKKLYVIFYILAYMCQFTIPRFSLVIALGSLGPCQEISDKRCFRLAEKATIAELVYVAWHFKPLFETRREN